MLRYCLASWVLFCLLLGLARGSTLDGCVSIENSTNSTNSTEVSVNCTTPSPTPTPTSSTAATPSVLQTISVAVTPTPVDATQTTTEKEKESGSSKLSDGAVAGIAVGVIAGVAVIAGGGILAAFLIIKFAKPGGSKVTPMKKGEAGKERVKQEKRSLVDSLPKPE